GQIPVASAAVQDRQHRRQYFSCGAGDGTLNSPAERVADAAGPLFLPATSAAWDQRVRAGYVRSVSKRPGPVQTGSKPAHIAREKDLWAFYGGLGKSRSGA